MKKKLQNNTNEKWKKNSLTGLFPLLALCALTGCSHEPSLSTETPTELETFQETETETESYVLDEERLLETLGKLKQQYGRDFTFAHLPMSASTKASEKNPGESNSEDAPAEEETQVPTAKNTEAEAPEPEEGMSGNSETENLETGNLDATNLEAETSETEKLTEALTGSDFDPEAQVSESEITEPAEREAETAETETPTEALTGSDFDPEAQVSESEITESEEQEAETAETETPAEALTGSDFDPEAQVPESEKEKADERENETDETEDFETEHAETEFVHDHSKETQLIDLADLNGVPDPLIYYTLMDYRQLADCPLPEIPLTIDTLEQRLIHLTENYSGQWSIYVKNLRTYDQILINDQPMKSASVMKLFIMGTVYEAIEEGSLTNNTEVDDLIHNMITYSSNSDSNQLLYLLGNGSYADGIAKVNRYIQSQRFAGETHEYNGFSDPATYTDPESFNQVSAKDCGRLLERIYRRTFGSRAVCNEIEEMMLNQDTRYKIPSGLPEETLVGNKTGEMDTAENDVAIVYGEKSDYILCVLSNDWDSSEEAISHIGEISSLVYRFFDDEAYYEATDTN